MSFKSDILFTDDSFRDGIFRFLGEESTTDLTMTDDPTWIIDPIDGTTNYIHKIPIFAIAVAFCVNKETLIGVTLNPAHDELYTARKGQGAYLNGKQIYCSNVTEVLFHQEFRYKVVF